MGRLSGKVAIITGGARGMGGATARLFVENGAKVVIGDVLDDVGQALADELGDSAVFLHMDISQSADWQSAIAAAAGLGQLNVLVNNAAILHVASITDTSEEDYMRVIRINQLGTFLGMQAVIPAMKAAGIGSIINVSSIDGLQSKNGLIAYSASKWAVRGMTKSAAIELGQHGIRVNSVHPGGVKTEMGGGEDTPDEIANEFYKNHPLPRVGKAHEVANVSLFLASDEASYCTGSEFVADGGWFAGLRQDIMPSS
jgi:3alpha(or 20beta)-hydroxysteroid dehydrogenase